MEKKTLPIEFLRAILESDPKTGVLTWRARPRSHFKQQWTYERWKWRFEGKRAGHVGVNGYRHLNLGVELGSFKAHRIVWALAHGKWPDLTIDHINGERDDNRLENLREAPPLQQGQNYSYHRYAAARGLI